MAEIIPQPIRVGRVLGGFSVLVIIWGFIVRDRVVPLSESAEIIPALTRNGETK